jgi:hypothetical protein
MALFIVLARASDEKEIHNQKSHHGYPSFVGSPYPTGSGTSGDGLSAWHIPHALSGGNRNVSSKCHDAYDMGVSSIHCQIKFAWTTG